MSKSLYDKFLKLRTTTEWIRKIRNSDMNVDKVKITKSFNLLVSAYPSSDVAKISNAILKPALGLSVAQKVDSVNSYSIKYNNEKEMWTFKLSFEISNSTVHLMYQK